MYKEENNEEASGQGRTVQSITNFVHEFHKVIKKIIVLYHSISFND